MLRAESYEVSLPDGVAEAIFSVLCKKKFLKISPNGHVDFWFSPNETSWYFRDAAMFLHAALKSYESEQWFIHVIRHQFLFRTTNRNDRKSNRNDQASGNSELSFEDHAKVIHYVKEEVERLRHHREDIFIAFGPDSTPECRIILSFLFRHLRKFIQTLTKLFFDRVDNRHCDKTQQGTEDAYSTTVSKPVNSGKNSKRGTRRPTNEQIGVYRLYEEMKEKGKNQTDVAIVLKTQTGTPWTQSKVSRAVKRVKEFLRAGGVMPDELNDTPPSRSPTPKRYPIDPHTLAKNTSTKPEKT